MKKFLPILFLAASFAGAQSLLRPPAWQVKGDWTNDSAYITSSGDDVQQILDNLDLVTTNLFLKTAYPNMDTDSTDDITNVVKGAAVVGGTVTTTNGSVTVGFPDLSGYVSNVVKGAAVGGGAVAVADGTLTIQFPTTNNLASTSQLVYHLFLQGGAATSLEPNNDSVQNTLTAVTWTSSEESVVYAAASHTGMVSAATDAFDAPTSGRYLFNVAATVDNDPDANATGHDRLLNMYLSTGTSTNALVQFGMVSDEADGNITHDRGIVLSQVRPLTNGTPVKVYLMGGDTASPIGVKNMNISVFRLGDL